MIAEKIPNNRHIFELYCLLIERNYFTCLNEIKLISKQTSIEIEQLNARVVEAETKLKTEVQRVKKKLQIQITELELTLDVANKNNIDLQKTIKKQSLTLTVISISTFINN